VDNLSSGFSTTGTWTESGAIDEYAGSSFWSETVGSTATWTPELPGAGSYEVYAWWNGARTRGRVFSRDAAASYEITHADGTTTVVVDQNLNMGQWVLLGEFTFDADGSEQVSLTRTTNVVGSATVADAVRWVSVDAATML